MEPVSGCGRSRMRGRPRDVDPEAAVPLLAPEMLRERMPLVLGRDAEVFPGFRVGHREPLAVLGRQILTRRLARLSSTGLGRRLPSRAAPRPAAALHW